MDWTYRKGEQTSVHKYLNYKSDREVKENAVETFSIKFKKYVATDAIGILHFGTEEWFFARNSSKIHCAEKFK